MKKLCVFLLLQGILVADPEGFKLISGDAQPPVIDISGNLTIRSGQQAIIQWDQFSIREQQKVFFQQLDSHSAVLNRVVGGSESALLGTLASNGSVYLINPSGVIIGPDGRIDTAGFLASTLDVLDQDFLKNGELHFANAGSGSITHLGKITCASGDVTLLAKQIVAIGTISAPEGAVRMASGSELLLMPSAENGILISAGFLSDEMTPVNGALISQSGSIDALTIEIQSAPSPYLKAIQCEGVLNAVEGVYMCADGGTNELTGKIRSAGGTVQIFGSRIHMEEGAEIDVSAPSGGGVVIIGGDCNNPDFLGPTADYIVVKEDTLIQASATDTGNGGRVILWGIEGAYHAGKICAEGGPNGGDGGFVEISAFESLIPKGVVHTLSPRGKHGTLLLDPTDVIISLAPDTNIGSTAGGIYTFSGTPAYINVSSLESLLAMGNVTINATTAANAGRGTIVVENGFSWNNNTTLTLIGTTNTPDSLGNVRGITFLSGSGYTISNTYNGGVNFDALVCNGTASQSNPIGILISRATFQTNYGNIKLTGVSSASTIAFGNGILTQSSNFVSNGVGSGAAQIILNGSLSTSTAANSKSGINASAVTFQTIDGDISLIGSFPVGLGVYFSNASVSMVSTGSADISLVATGGCQLLTTGVPFYSLTCSGTGNISVSGSSVVVQGTVSNSSVVSTTSGDIDFTWSTATGGVSAISRTQVSSTTGAITFNATNQGSMTLTQTVSHSISTTTGNMTFNTPITYASSNAQGITSTSGSITFNGTFNGAFPFSPHGSTISFNSAVGGTTPLTSLTPVGTLCNIGANITTVNAQTFNLPVVTTASSILTVTGASQAITFGSTLEGPGSLTVTSPLSSFSGLIGDVTPLASLTVNSNVNQSAALIATTSGNMSFNGDIASVGYNVVLTSTGGDVQVRSISAADITLQPAYGVTPGLFGNIPDGFLILAGGSSTIHATGAISFSGVGRAQPISVASIISSVSVNNTETITGNSFFVGSNEVMTVYGNLHIGTTGNITVGDTIASNTISLNGGSITVHPHGNIQILAFIDELYTSPSAHFISSTTPGVSPAPTGSVRILAVGLAPLGFQTFLQEAGGGYILNFDTTIPISFGCASCSIVGAFPKVQPEGFIINSELVANSQLTELVPILMKPMSWPVWGSFCEKEEVCEAVSWESFIWNNDVQENFLEVSK